MHEKRKGTKTGRVLGTKTKRRNFRAGKNLQAEVKWEVRGGFREIGLRRAHFRGNREGT